jgi:Protein of unknown function (DUF4229)
MRTALSYTVARLVLFLAALVLLYFAGARGLLLAALALLVSGIASFVLLSRQRDVMSGALTSRLRGMRNRAGDFSARLDEGTRAEDDDLTVLARGDDPPEPPVARCGARRHTGRSPGRRPGLAGPVRSPARNPCGCSPLYTGRSPGREARIRWAGTIACS